MPDISLMSVIISALVRTTALRPAINRFIVNGQIFARHDIEVSFVVKKTLKDDSPETTVKLKFDGTETIAEITQRIADAVHENLKASGSNDTDKLAEKFMKLPNGIIKTAVGFIKWLDRRGMIPKGVIEASPFHASFFLTNMRSIKLDYLYHHLYDFGTVSLFLSMGKTHKDAEDKNKNHFYIGYTIDERICDGFYLSNTMRLFESFLADPSRMEQKLEAKTEDIK